MSNDEHEFQCSRCHRMTPAIDGGDCDEFDKNGDMCSECWCAARTTAILGVKLTKLQRELLELLSKKEIVICRNNLPMNRLMELELATGTSNVIMRERIAAITELGRQWLALHTKRYFRR